MKGALGRLVRGLAPLLLLFVLASLGPGASAPVHSAPHALALAVTADTGFRFPLDTPFTRYYRFASPHACGPYHNGVDYHVGYQAAVHAVASGMVFTIGNDSAGYGHYIVLQHELPETGEVVYSLYAHLDSAPIPSAGQSVEKGQVIGYEGESGMGSNGIVHLHFELRRRWLPTQDKCGNFTLERLGDWFYNPDLFIPKHTYTEGVTLYEHAGYGGSSWAFTEDDGDLCDNVIDWGGNPPGASRPCDIPGVKTMNDIASSLTMASGWEARLHIHNAQDAAQWGDDATQGFPCGSDMSDFAGHSFPNGTPLNDNVSRVLVARCAPTTGALLSLSGSQDDICLPDPGPVSCVDSADFQHVESFPDGTMVQPGQSMDKWWRVKNTGTCDWSGYHLMFESGEQIGGPSLVAIPNAPAGGTVDIHVSMQAPSASGEHAGYWRIVSPTGAWVEGGRLWIKVNVAGSTPTDHILSFTADPPPPSSANTVLLHARVNWWPEFRAMRVRVGDQSMETSETDHVFQWDTASAPRGETGIVLEVATHSDTSWSNPERRTIVYTLEGEPAPLNHAPNRPTLVSPYDWYVTVGSPPQLCAQAQGDPDGDPVNEYYFDVRGHDLWNSGWVSSNCVTPSGLGYWTYEWSAKVRDSHGAESEWSDNWHFSIRSDTITITDLHFVPASPSDATEVKIYSCTDGLAGVGITQRTEVNTAANGSDSGEWKIIKELGVPCYNDIDVPVWQTLPFEDGDHLVRVLARGPDDTQWQGASIRYETYHLNHRRPASPDLVAPAHNSWVNSRTVTFRWTEAIRAQSYTLRVSTDANPDTNSIVDQTLPAGTTTYQFTFNQDYQDLYWWVYANNDQGSTSPGAWHFGIDRTVPVCAVTPLDPTVLYNVLPVNWSGSDSPSAVRSYDIQVRDGARGSWADWLTDVPSETTVSLFNGQPGHSYYFRCRATDLADNSGTYATGDGDTHTLVDPTSAPTPPWWDSSYALKRNLTVLNNMSILLPAGYPVRLHLDSTTSPTAADVYNASLSSTKCNDLRITYDNQTQLDRVVQNCTAYAIDVFFRTQASIPPLSADQASYQLYYGYAGAGTPPGSYGTVFYPSVDSHTRAALYFQEGTGSVAYDSSGYGNNGTFPSDITWSTGKWGSAILFPGNDDINGGVDLGRRSSLNLPQITFEGWFQNDRPTAYDHLFSQRETYPLLKFVLSHVNDKLILNYWDDLAHGMHEYFLQSPSYTPDSGWHHYAFTYDGSTMRIYYDGVQKASSSFTGFTTSQVRTEIGASQGVHRPLGRFQNVRISDIARSPSDFWYATFAHITTEPSLGASVALTPPASGTPDLVLESLNAYPAGSELEGGVIVQAVLSNEGDRATENGFFTDLYSDHLPSGPGDYSGSLGFWVDNPIEAGSTVTLTTLLTGTQTGLAAAMLEGSITESSTTLYGQTDSAGSVTEPDDQNNISQGVEVCVASDDLYEPDNSPAEAQPILGLQTHNTNTLTDEDWVSFSAEAGQTYALATSNLGLGADTYLYLYDTDAATLLAANDDYGGTLASRIVWECPATGTYYAAVKHWNPNVSGCGTTYDLSFREQHAVFLPLAFKRAEMGSASVASAAPAVPTATPTPVELVTVAPNLTPTATDTATAFPEPTITATVPVTNTATLTPTPSPTEDQEPAPEPTTKPTPTPTEVAVPTPTELPTPTEAVTPSTTREKEGSP
jgi:hypothetical protein